MAAKVEAFIDFNGDFSKVEQKWDKFFKSIENKDIIKNKQTFNRYTADYLKTMDDAFNKMYKKRTDLEERITAYVNQRMKMGKYPNLGGKTPEQFKQERVARIKGIIESKYAKQLQANIEEEKKAKKDELFKQMGAVAPSQYKTLKGQSKATQKYRDNLQKEASRNEKNLLKEMQNTQSQIDKNMAKREKIRIKDEKDRLAKEQKDRKAFYNALFMKWGKLGIAGLIAGQAIKYITRGATAINQVAQTSLGHQMTIEGGASEGGFFGGSLAAMQRAGISAKEYGSWKRGMMGKVGAIKLGMGNAAPFMALGVSALDRMDDIELEIEKRLQRLPAETSWALGSQMGMSYELWERMYKGEIDRSKPGYDEDAIKAWAEAAKNINAVLTDIKVFFYNTLGPLAKLLTTKEGIADVATAGMGVGAFLPGGMGYNLGTRLSLGITVKKDGNIAVDTSEMEKQNIDTAIEFTGN